MSEFNRFLLGPATAYALAVKQGFDGTLDEWLASLKGNAFTYDDFTHEQLQALKGAKGDAFTYEDFTQEQLNALKGAKGDSFTYEDFTEDQLESLRGPSGKNGVTPHIGSNGNWFVGTTDTGIPATGPVGPAGPALAVTNTAAVGQTIKVSAVDENGKPTEWEAVEFPSGDVGYMKLLFDITTTEPVLKIETGIDLNQYSDIFAHCTSVSSDETKTTHFDWLVFGDSDMNSVRITNGLHATQERMFTLRLSRLYDNVVYATAWRGSTASKFSRVAEGSVVEQVNIGGTILNNFCCMAYKFGGTMLAAGTKLTVYGR